MMRPINRQVILYINIPIPNSNVIYLKGMAEENK